MYPPAVQEGDVVRLDVDLWEPLVEPGRVSPTPLEAAGAGRAGARGAAVLSEILAASDPHAATQTLIHAWNAA